MIDVHVDFHSKRFLFRGWPVGKHERMRLAVSSLSHAPAEVSGLPDEINRKFWSDFTVFFSVYTPANSQPGLHRPKP